MSKLTVYGELYLEDQDWSDEWCGEVELDDEQAGNLIRLIMYAGYLDVERLCLKRHILIFMTSWIRRATKQRLRLITSILGLAESLK